MAQARLTTVEKYLKRINININVNNSISPAASGRCTPTRGAALGRCPYNVRMKFEWDAAKANTNLKKHRVSFDEAKSVFYDELAVQFFDDEHSAHEERFILLGMSSGARLLVVCHCERGEGGVIRIISARKATHNESTFYPGA